MAIKMVLEHHKEQGDIFCPLVFCDHCGQEIADGNDGDYVWKIGEKMSDIFFAHRDCHLPFEESHGGDESWLSLPLAIFPLYLAGNLHVDFEEAIQMADDLMDLEEDP